MIECSFCSTSKSQRYVYTSCHHLICLNCAALRAGETLMCCNKITNFQEEVKTQLKNKKQAILSNLQNGYEYERTDVNRISFDQIEQRLRKIDRYDDNSQRYQRKVGDQVSKEQEKQINDQMNTTPIDQFYKRCQIIPKHEYEFEESTPIKLVTNTDQQEDQVRKTQQSNQTPLFTERRSLNTQPSNKKNCQPKITKQDFIPILQEKIHHVRSQFKILYEELQKVQATMIYQLKIYFQEYVKLIEKENQESFKINQNIFIEKDRVDTFLNQFVQKSKLKQLKNAILTQKIKSNSPQIRKQQFEDIKVLKEKQKPKQTQPLQSCRLNYPVSSRKEQVKQNYFDKLRLSSPEKSQNIEISQSLSTNRNLDKIYRKLQESRTKLQERIQSHNDFMNKRCIKLSNY